MGDATVAKAMRQAAEQAQAAAVEAEAQSQVAAREAAAKQAAATTALVQEDGNNASQLQQAGQAVSEV